MMKQLLFFTITLCFLNGCSDQQPSMKTDFIIANGQMPHAAIDEKGVIHIVYGRGDSLLYINSTDEVKSFSAPYLISIVPELAASHTRGPQIVATDNGLTVIACTSPGDIFSYRKTGAANWEKGGRVNDADTIAKEGLMAMGGDGGKIFAAWLDLRDNLKNKIYGSSSDDGGKTWAANKLVYASPDSTVCECCKPSVLMRGNNVFVMFRNWLSGSRDMYLATSRDGGNTFLKPQKLGQDTWKLDGCPMDGGGLTTGKNGEIETVWRRKNKIYAAVPGLPEKEIGEGRSCTVETLNSHAIYSWTEQDNIVVMPAGGAKKIIGKGSLPVLKALNNDHVLCVWENNKQIHATIF